MPELEFEQKMKLKKYQHDLNMHRQLIKTSTQYCLKAINALFLLNGAAATAILNHGDNKLYAAGIVFAIAAVLAVFIMGAGYYINLVYSESWILDIPEAAKKIEKYHLRTAYAAAINLFLSIIAIIMVTRGIS